MWPWADHFISLELNSFMYKMTLESKGKYRWPGKSVIFSLEVGLSLHPDVETSKGELVVIPKLGSPNLPLENLGIFSPPHFPFPTFPYQLNVWLVHWPHRVILVTGNQLWLLSFGAERGLKTSLYSSKFPEKIVPCSVARGQRRSSLGTQSLVLSWEVPFSTHGGPYLPFLNLLLP